MKILVKDILVKIAIWLVVFYIGLKINSMIGNAIGVEEARFVLYLLEGLIAKKLCEKYDEIQRKKYCADEAVYTDSRAESDLDENASEELTGQEAISAVKVCRQCGAEIPEDSTFCSNCGAEVN